MTINFSRMKKSEIVWMANHKCKHCHTYLEHPQCYDTDHGRDQKIGFLDLECSNLEADFGIILCYCIADLNSDEILHKVITKKELGTCLDAEVTRDCIRSLKKFDKIITYYGTGFDLPFLRTRAVSQGIDFPEYGELVHNDMYYVVRNKFKLSRNRLDNVCQTLFGETEKTRITAEHWIKALQGNAASLAYILDHCKKDVTELKKLYNKIINYRRGSDVSI